MEIVANVAKLPLSERKLRCRSGFNEYTFSYDDRYVTIESKYSIEARSKKYDLWRLIPIPATEEVLRPEAVNQGRRGIAFLLAAVIVFFSEFRWSFPLLVPILAVVGLLESSVGWYRARPRTYTNFFGSDAGALVCIPIEVLEGNREAFIHGLSEAIRSARAAAYGTSAV